jgi:hypothetical protein
MAIIMKKLYLERYKLFCQITERCVPVTHVDNLDIWVVDTILQVAPGRLWLLEFYGSIGHVRAFVRKWRIIMHGGRAVVPNFGLSYLAKSKFLFGNTINICGV